MAIDRPFRFPDDVFPVRDLLVELLPLLPFGMVWDVRRWDGSIFYGATPGLSPERAARTRLWVTGGGRVVAAALWEGGRQIHPQVHPDHAHLLPEVVAWSEQAAAAAGQFSVLLHVWDQDAAGHRLAVERGYRLTAGWEVVRWVRPGRAGFPAPEAPAGYTIRETGDDPSDHRALADLLNVSFGRTIHEAAETMGFARHAPSFRRDLDLVAEAPDGGLAAYAAVCWDAANHHAIFEPVCTHPVHRGRGVARAVMLEGMRRARDLGAQLISVGTGDGDAANALYASLPFTWVHRGRFWEKSLA